MNGTCSTLGEISRDMRTEHALRNMQREGLWNGSFSGRESTLQQLAPFIGKLKTGIVHTLIEHFTDVGDVVCDPFAGCGVVPLEALLLGRRTIASDLSPYALCITRGKATAPPTLERAEAKVEKLINHVEETWEDYDLRKVDAWVRKFFHPRTLKEILAAFEFCQSRREWFLAASLLGILHHQRPGFLSYPSSHMVPYLRTGLFPEKEYPEMYGYRPLGERLRKKVKRAYRRTTIDTPWKKSDFEIRKANARALPYADNSVDFVLSSPPYYDALDYARDNRLRLWFLGQKNWKELNEKLTTSNRRYESEMRESIKEMHRILKPGKKCVLIVGEVQKNGKTRDTASILGRLAAEATNNGFAVDCVVEDLIPDSRRSRRGTKATRIEKILVFGKDTRETA